MKRLTEFDTTQLADPTFSRAVIDWQKQHGRHALPWQNTRDAYRIWLSEIMLQQTQVTAVLGYYARFLERFPTVQSLAEAPLEDVMTHWSGLGYYTRARNLHACAKRVVEAYGGAFPSDPALLAELPGIGRSTAAAIAAFSYGTRAAIMDGNVKRVFARVFGVDRYPGIKPVEDALWRRADALLPDGPDGGIEAYTQGLMDLGATLCTRGRPDCKRCPLQDRCVAYATDRTGELPVPKPKKATPEKRAIMLAVVDAGQVLLQQRPESGIWGGLLSLPEVDGHVGVDEADAFDAAQLANVAGEFGAVGEVEALLPLVHGFTHYRLHIQPYRVALDRRGDTPAGHVWWDLGRILDAPLPAPVKKLLEQLGQPNLFMDDYASVSAPLPVSMPARPAEVVVRLNPKPEVRRRLFALSVNRCAFPACVHPVIDEDGTLLAEICHIEGALPDSERFNRHQSNEQRRAFENLILLCSTHHKMTNNTDKYSVAVMRAMKHAHESKAFGTAALSTAQTSRFIDATSTPSYALPVNFRMLDTADWESDTFDEAARMLDAIARLPFRTRSLYAHALVHASVERDIRLLVDPEELAMRLEQPMPELDKHFALLVRYGLWTEWLADDDYAGRTCFHRHFYFRGMGREEQGAYFLFLLHTRFYTNTDMLCDIIENLNFLLLDA